MKKLKKENDFLKNNVDRLELQIQEFIANGGQNNRQSVLSNDNELADLDDFNGDQD